MRIRVYGRLIPLPVKQIFSHNGKEDAAFRFKGVALLKNEFPFGALI